MLKREINIFLTAIMFYTRIPCPRWIDHSENSLNKSSRYFTLVGLIVGAIVAFVYFLAAIILPVHVAVIFSMISGILITGGFHEDGLADVCDGFGGGWKPADRLTIMKDSRIGTYGSLGLIFVLLTKFILLVELSQYNLIITLVVAHIVSRLMPVITIYTGTYAREDLTSKVKPIAKQIGLREFLPAILIALASIALYMQPLFYTLLILPTLMGLLLQRYFLKRIGGYTGDCLGTIQQVSEVSIYLSVLILNRNFL